MPLRMLRQMHGEADHGGGQPLAPYRPRLAQPLHIERTNRFRGPVNRPNAAISTGARTLRDAGTCA